MTTTKFKDKKELDDTWDIMKKIATLNNQGKADELHEYLNSIEIESNTPIAEMAITAFEITDENIKNNLELAIKLSKLKCQSMRESIRFGLLEVKLKEIKAVV